MNGFKVCCGGMDTNIYIACLRQGFCIRKTRKRLLPASGRWSHSLPRFKLMRRLRRRTSKGFMIGSNDMYNNDVGKGVVYVYEAYEAK